MKRLSDQTLYEILEVSVEAPPEEIERAYERARALYGPGSLATYTLMSPDEATLLNNRIEEAKVVLLDADARSRYDERIGVRPKSTPPPAAPPSLAAPVGQAPVTQGAGTPWPPPSAPAATPVPEAAVASSTATVRPPEPPLPPAPIALQTPIATPPPGVLPAVTVEPAAAPEPAQAPPPPLPASPGAAPLAGPPGPAPSAAPPAPPVPAPAGAPIPLDKEVSLPRDLLVPEGSAWTGAMLRQVREARGITVAQISERTKVTRHHIENIEADRFAALPAAVYLRGILMSLSRELRLDGQKVARSYLERIAAGGGAGGEPKK